MREIKRGMRLAGLQPEESEALLGAYTALPLSAQVLMTEARQAYDLSPEFPYAEYCDRLGALVDEAQRYSAWYLLAMRLIPRMYEYYADTGLSPVWFWSAMRDFRVKLHECRTRYDQLGWFKPKWFGRWFSLRRIALRRLQFELQAWGCARAEHSGTVLEPQSLTVNVHIPGEAPLDEADCRRDYRDAAEYFAPAFPDGVIPFRCVSWLLHPEHPQFLDPDSRILAFQQRYTITEFRPDPAGSSLWRLFGTDYNGKPDQLPERNRLEKAYKAYLLSGGLSGEGAGFFLYRRKAPGAILQLNPELPELLRQSRRPLNLGADQWRSRTPILTLLHFSDLHGAYRSACRITELMEDVDGLFEDALFTGDMARSFFASGVDWRAQVPGWERILLCIGNHDVLNNREWNWEDLVPQTVAAETYLQPSVSYWGRDVLYTPGTTYYRKLYPRNRISLIVLNSMLSGEDDAVQQTFLAERLEEARTLGFGAVIAIHDTPQERQILDCGFSALLQPASAPCGPGCRVEYQQLVEQFRQDGGEFLCYLAGHTHRDFLCVNPAFPQQLFFIVGAASPFRGVRHGDCDRQFDTKSEDLMNFVSFDVDAKLIKVVRCGADRDSFLRPRRTLTVRYDTGEILCQS